MKKIFIAIGLAIVASLLFSTRWSSPGTSTASTRDSVLNGTIETLPTSDDEGEPDEQEVKYYYKGKEISKEQYEAYQVQIRAVRAQLQVLRAFADEHDRNTPNITYKRYSDGRVETRIDP